MNTVHTTARRFIAAAVAAGTTLVVFSSVVAIGEPQRSTLMALQHAVPAGGVQLAAAPALADATRQ